MSSDLLPISVLDISVFGSLDFILRYDLQSGLEQIKSASTSHKGNPRILVVIMFSINFTAYMKCWRHTYLQAPTKILQHFLLASYPNKRMVGPPEYRPITRLPTIYKILTLCLTSRISRFYKSLWPLGYFTSRQY